jgi:Spy/CpxP family protein refolding chaperone
MKAAAKATMVITLVFIIGFVSGIGTITGFQALRLYKPWHTTRFFQQRSARDAPHYANRIKQLARELELTPEQRKQFEPVLQAGMEKIRAVRQKHRPEIHKVLLETRSQLRSILNEEQCRRFDELSAPMRTGRDMTVPGGCLQNYSGQKHRRGPGRERRMRQQKNF